MTTDPPPTTDAKALWRSQPLEAVSIDPTEIRRRARRFQRRKRLTNAVEYAASALVIVIFLAYVRILPGILLKLASAYGILWTLVYAWLRHRLMSAHPLPDDATACLDFHRGELERQRDVLRRGWRWILAPMAPLLVLMVLGRLLEAPAPGRAPWLDHLFIIGGTGLFLESLWLIALWLQNRADVLQDRIDDLGRLGSQTP